MCTSGTSGGPTTQTSFAPLLQTPKRSLTVTFCTDHLLPFQWRMVPASPTAHTSSPWPQTLRRALVVPLGALDANQALPSQWRMVAPSPTAHMSLAVPPETPLRAPVGPLGTLDF